MIGLIDVGGTKLLAGIAGGDGAVERTVRRSTPPEDPVGTLAAMLDEVRDGAPLEAIGGAVPGPLDRATGAFADPPNLPPAWRRAPLAAGLGERFGCPVVLENDANCAGLAEARWGAGRGLRTVVYYTVSTGIGSGVVRDGRLVATREDTEGGHQVLWPPWLDGPPCQCGGAGCLEALASGGAIERRFGRRGEDLDDDDAWDEIGRWLGQAVVNTTALHDPDAVVFGGGVCNAWDRFRPALERTVGDLLHLQRPPQVLLGTLGDSRNLLGALALVAA